MIIATLKEISSDENRVAISPDTCKKYCKKGFSVYIEKNDRSQIKFFRY